ncbi:alpha/beta hydrolase [Colwellia psychrerythraea]|uniref:Esterase n=1 Tax=Colwellia psychrerythraea TaxID=28229 RepID=A0A099KLX2_COLPS|nr:alpha/beta hydrolase-fold protein [Colwellia psychrerythraea]KGJ90942.1 esterase [Colwellia psychrerythraea]
MPLLVLIIFLVVLSPSSNAAQPFEIPRSSVVDLQDSTSKRIYPLFIKLPKSYSNNIDKKYPVIYLTDAWYSFQIVSGATRYPMNSGKMAEAIIVGISYAKGSKGDTSRVLDYTPSKNSQWKKNTGGAQQHMTFIEKDVFNYMAANYRVDTKQRTFIGNSLGGLFGSYILLTKPDMFKNYILGSPSYWFDNKSLFALADKASLNMVDINANVFIAIGERESKALESSYEMVEDAQQFYQKILTWQQEKLTVKMLVIPEANHQTAFPTTAIQGLHWVLATDKKT